VEWRDKKNVFQDNGGPTSDGLQMHFAESPPGHLTRYGGDH
jgi:hypothetical protein